MKLWTCLVTPCLPSQANSGPPLSVSLRSVSSVSLTVPPGCLQEEGFLENGRLLPREVSEWRKGAPSLPSSSSIVNLLLLLSSFHSIPPHWASIPSWVSTDWVARGRKSYRRQASSAAAAGQQRQRRPPIPSSDSKHMARVRNSIDLTFFNELYVDHSQSCSLFMVTVQSGFRKSPKIVKS